MAAKSKSTYWASPSYCFGPHSLRSNVKTSTGLISTTLTDTRTDPGPIKDWRKRIREGKQATTNLVGDVWKVSRTQIHGFVNMKLTDGVFGDLRPCSVKFAGYPQYAATRNFAPYTTIVDGIAEREATKKFYRKVAAMRKSLDGLVFMGELRQTLRMLRSPAKSLFDSARNDYLAALKKRKHRDPKNWARGLSGAWLEWFFGVMPLVNDINGILGGMDRFNDEPIFRAMITAVGRSRAAQPTSDTVWSPASHSHLKFSGTFENAVSQKIKYRGLYYRERSTIADLPGKQKFAETFGLNLREFVPAVWELMPWSFLVDYFSNVGDILEQTFSSLENLNWVNRTRIDTGTQVWTMGLDVPATKAILSSNPGFWEYVGHTFKGDASSKVERRNWSREVRSPSVSPFYLEIPGSPQKWLNIAALGVQANSIHPQRFNFRR